MTLPWSNCCAVKWDPRYETALQTVERGPSVPSPCSPWGLRSHLGAVSATASTTFPVPRPGSPTVKCKFSPTPAPHCPHKPSTRSYRASCSVSLSPPGSRRMCERCKQMHMAHTPLQRLQGPPTVLRIKQNKTKQKTQHCLPDPMCGPPARHNTPWGPSIHHPILPSYLLVFLQISILSWCLCIFLESLSPNICETRDIYFLVPTTVVIYIYLCNSFISVYLFSRK